MKGNTGTPIEVLKGGEIVDVCTGARQAAERYGVSTASIYRMVSDGYLYQKNPELTFRFQPAPHIDEEEWRPVRGYETRYAVSNMGRLRNVRTGRILNAAKSYRLSKPAKHEFRYIWRLVADAFVSGKTEYTKYVLHLDGNLKNNKAENLQWSATPLFVVSPVEAWQEGALTSVFPSTRMAEKTYRTKNGTIRYVCMHRGQTKKIPGVYFRFAPEKEGQ